MFQGGDGDSKSLWCSSILWLGAKGIKIRRGDFTIMKIALVKLDRITFEHFNRCDGYYQELERLVASKITDFVEVSDEDYALLVSNRHNTKDIMLITLPDPQSEFVEFSVKSAINKAKRDKQKEELQRAKMAETIEKVRAKKEAKVKLKELKQLEALKAKYETSKTIS